MHQSVMVITKTADPAELELAMEPFSEHLEVPEWTDEAGDRCVYNPNGKWDYWRIGGRWAGMLAVRDPELAVRDPEHNVFYLASPSWEWVRDDAPRSLREVRLEDVESTWPGLQYGAADAAYKRDIDFDRIGAIRHETLKRQWAEAYAKREQFASNHASFRFITGVIWDEPESDYITRVMGDMGFAVETNAYLDLDGEWHEKPYPDHRLKDDEWRAERERLHVEWSAQFRAFWDALPDDAFVWILDCHS